VLNFCRPHYNSARDVSKYYVSIRSAAVDVISFRNGKLNDFLTHKAIGNRLHVLARTVDALQIVFSRMLSAHRINFTCESTSHSS